MKQKKILSVVGARPNFMKVAPMHRAFVKSGLFESKIVHTGQHYDEKMSKIFFDQLELPIPDYFLGAKGDTPTLLLTNIMTAFEDVLIHEKPDLVIVVGDVTSTLACALVAVQNKVKVAHVEAGLRSFDRAMPEEINRILTDAISDYLFISEYEGLVNLTREGVSKEKMFHVGNCMIDSLLYYENKDKKTDLCDVYKVEPQAFIIVTMHRPSNVDNEDGLLKIISILKKLAVSKKIIFPIHPRTANNIHKLGLKCELDAIENLIITEPLGYLEFIGLLKNSYCVLTDSGGIQEESTFLGIPCVTFRENTERPITCEIGTNFLMEELNVAKTVAYVQNLETIRGKSAHQIPMLWDGKAAERIVNILTKKI